MIRGQCAAVGEPLVIVIVIKADDIQVSRIATERRLDAARQHIPGFKLRFMQPRGQLTLGAALIAWHHVDQRIGSNKTGIGEDFSDRSHRRQRGAHQLLLQGTATTTGPGIKPGDVTAGP